ncbi:MAG: ATP synthase F1 subunit epsilon [Phycisphaerales bacterium]|nr:ATP synthase F1 subunit epsilon [Phycisphaerales bacterium]
MATSLRCTVVTPSASILEVDATYVAFPAWDGSKGVQAGAAAFLAKLGEGVLRVDGVGGSKRFVIDGGFAQMQGETLTILADSATPIDQVDAAKASQELDAANADVNKRGTIAERATIERRQRAARAKLAVARPIR